MSKKANEDEKLEEQPKDLQIQFEELQKQLAEQTNKAKENFDLMLRAKAEVENTRRRAAIDIENAHKYSQEKFAKEILAVVDSLQRGLESVKNPEDEAIKNIYEGMELTFKLLLDTLDKFQIKQVSKVGDDFDPKMHEALATEESNEVEANKILKVLQPGFSMHDRVLRSALVVVASSPKTSKVDENA